MIIKALTLENFKGIREPVRIEFAPLTLLFGPNNAGKSTIVQALMYAREVLERNNCDARRTELGGETVDLGGFENLVHRHDTTRSIRMRFELGIDLADLAASQESPDEDDGFADEDDERHDTRMSEIVNLDALSALSDDSADLWVELEIGWLEARSRRSSSGPGVLRYCVGRGPSKYVEITVDDVEECARLSFLDSKLFPVLAAHYFQGEKSDFDWDLERDARRWLRLELLGQGNSRRGLRRGATVAAPDEVVRPGTNKMARVDFDNVVSEIVRGEGLWGDDTVDPETRKQNRRYMRRQELLDHAEIARRVRSDCPEFWERRKEGFIGYGDRGESDREAVAKRRSGLAISPEVVTLDFGEGPVALINQRTGEVKDISIVSEDLKLLNGSTYLSEYTLTDIEQYDGDGVLR
ncbi:AAA family ATPase, partial [uncultured Thiodictyon sp.]|uniref:AAA family ATPase n=1 Tax=uncultured Thiodictyon sp. TaxID=1846217 RepID=UPI0025FBFFED